MVEVALSTQVTVMVGKHSFPFADLYGAVEGVSWLCWPNPLRPHKASNIITGGRLQRRVLTDTLRIENVIDALRGLKVFEDRRKMRPVGAIATCWKEKNPFPREGTTIYSYKYATIKAVNPDTTLYPLSLSRSGISEDGLSGLGMPQASWVPNWDAPSPVYHLNDIGSSFAASTAPLIQPNYVDSSGQDRKQYIVVRGHIVDTILSVTEYLPPRREVDRYHVASLNSIRFPEWYDWARRKAQSRHRTASNSEK